MQTGNSTNYIYKKKKKKSASLVIREKSTSCTGQWSESERTYLRKIK